MGDQVVVPRSLVVQAEVVVVLAELVGQVVVGEVVGCCSCCLVSCCLVSCSWASDPI